MVHSPVLAAARPGLPTLMALVRQRRVRRNRRQDALVVLLTALLAVVEVSALLAEQRRHPRPRRKPIAVALVSTPLNRRPPTPDILPPPPLPPRPTTPAAAEPALPTRPALPAHPPRHGRPAAPDGDRPPSPPVVEEAGTHAPAPPDPVPSPPDPPQPPQPPAEPAPVVPPAGGRRHCAHDGPGAPVTTSPSTSAATMPPIPTLLIAPFRTRPGLGDYLAEIEYLGRSGPRALGTFRIALPEQVIRFELDEPGGAAIYVGRTDARCAAVAVIKGRPLIVRLRGVPVRLVDRARRVASAIVDLEMDQQANLTIVHRAGDALPFTRARLANAGAIAASIGGHLAASSGR